MQSLHIVEAQQFHRPFLQKLFRETSIIRDAMLHRSVDIEDRAVARRLFLVLQRRLVLILFTEPSMRTKQSFLSAAHHLGASVAQESDAQVSSSFAKGETVHDAMRVLDGYHYAAIVMRHHDSLEMMQAAEALERTPLINAGSGAGQHPTQALLDVYTIEQELGRVDNISIAFVGDLANGRTVRSVCYLLTKFNKPRVYFVAPDVVRMRDDIKAYLTLHGVQWEETSDLLGVASQVDVIYQTRIQRERFGDRIRDY
ncbi:MAG: aspartate carbamoyltransferase, partial [Patescibacteria group bacterium]|nr:aspartate carbamoyltransferase [Patescibacteria group bacterium]